MKHQLRGAAFLTAILLATGPVAAGDPRPSSAKSAEHEQAEVRELFAEYLRLHAAKEMERWQALFLPEAICVRTGSDGVVTVYPVAQLARSIAETAKTLASQHETFEDVRIEVHGHAAVYSTYWSLFHNGEKARQGRAFFSLIKNEGRWRIASLVWYRD